jgi:isopentenyl diphosphate isomerase/L-lactate dehydrogenase-like FMN-dependent dehydrogenase
MCPSALAAAIMALIKVREKFWPAAVFAGGGKKRGSTLFKSAALAIGADCTCLPCCQFC